MQSNEKNEEKTDFERAYIGCQEYESLVSKLDKTLSEKKRMEVLYEALRKEAPYLLDFYE